MMMIAAQTYKRTTPKMRRGGRKRLSLIKMVLLRHLKAGFGKGVTAVLLVMVNA